MSNLLPRDPYESGSVYPGMLEKLLLTKKSETNEDIATNLTESISKSGETLENGKSNGFIPTLYRASFPSLFLDLENDTYVDTQGWGKGVLFVVYYKEGEKPKALNLGRFVNSRSVEEIIKITS